jgi:hypothetical protein
MALTNPTSEDALKLFKEVELQFPSATLGDDKWEILAVLIRSVRPVINTDTSRSLRYQVADIQLSRPNCTNISSRNRSTALLISVRHS